MEGGRGIGGLEEAGEGVGTVTEVTGALVVVVVVEVVVVVVEVVGLRVDGLRVDGF